MKKKLLLVVLFLLVLFGVVGYFVFRDSDGILNANIYELHLKVNSLVTFKFKKNNDNYVITDFVLVDDKAKEIFSSVDFIGMDLISAIDFYGDKVASSKIVFSNIYVFTNFDNVEYFKSDKYNLKVKIIDDDFKGILDETKAVLKYNTKYYLMGDKHGYSITFLDDGVLEYHVDNEYSEKICDEFDSSNCYDLVYNDAMYADIASTHQYRLDGNYVIIEGKDGVFYNGWYYSYDKCEIMFNKIKCDNYNAYHGTVAQYQYTHYYEIG